MPSGAWFLQAQFVACIPGEHVSEEALEQYTTNALPTPEVEPFEKHLTLRLPGTFATVPVSNRCVRSPLTHQVLLSHSGGG